MNQYVSQSSILVHCVVLQVPFVDFGPFFRLRYRLTQMETKTDIGSQSL